MHLAACDSTGIKQDGERPWGLCWWNQLIIHSASVYPDGNYFKLVIVVFSELHISKGISPKIAIAILVKLHAEKFHFRRWKWLVFQSPFSAEFSPIMNTQKSLTDSFRMERNMVTVILLNMNQIEFHLVHNQMENSRYHRIPFNSKGIRISISLRVETHAVYWICLGLFYTRHRVGNHITCLFFLIKSNCKQCKAFRITIIILLRLVRWILCDLCRTEKNVAPKWHILTTCITWIE